MKIIWRKRALADLDAALDYIAKDSASRARSTRERILDSLALLEQWPDAGRVGRRADRSTNAVFDHLPSRGCEARHIAYLAYESESLTSNPEPRLLQAALFGVSRMWRVLLRVALWKFASFGSAHPVAHGVGGVGR
jgi:plasmid stabilization system protein ParE